VSAYARRRWTHRLVKRAERRADIQPEKAEHREPAKPRKDITARDFR
jgi:hypothetical protein